MPLRHCCTGSILPYTCSACTIRTGSDRSPARCSSRDTRPWLPWSSSLQWSSSDPNSSCSARTVPCMHRSTAHSTWSRWNCTFDHWLRRCSLANCCTPSHHPSENSTTTCTVDTCTRRTESLSDTQTRWSNSSTDLVRCRLGSKSCFRAIGTRWCRRSQTEYNRMYSSMQPPTSAW